MAVHSTRYKRNFQRVGVFVTKVDSLISRYFHQTFGTHDDDDETCGWDRGDVRVENGLPRLDSSSSRGKLIVERKSGN